ncbi:MAG TPA: hydrogenase maturation nickel metallochaperone HypA [Polyangia bacterium]|jgi:hydrogenase nickel incorporation protein HypA/HybF|nr:hydrogenase maturation nickel metallochaperone HypA [Polyangia bacterium]
MHELALMEGVVSTIEDRTRPARVVRVLLEIGRLSGAVPDALRFCFEACAKDTTLEGATLDIDEIAGCARCQTCGREIAIATFLDFCPCGGAALDVLAGQELRIKSVEVA